MGANIMSVVTLIIRPQRGPDTRRLFTSSLSSVNTQDDWRRYKSTMARSCTVSFSDCLYFYLDSLAKSFARKTTSPKVVTAPSSKVSYHCETYLGFHPWLSGKVCSKTRGFCLLNDKKFLDFGSLWLESFIHHWSKLCYFKERHLGPPTDTKAC